MNISLLALYVYLYHMWWFVSMTPLSHCILKQLLVSHINCKDITDYTQSYHSRKATRQPTHFYNSKGTVGGEWNLTRHIGRVEYNEHGHRAGGQTRSKIGQFLRSISRFGLKLFVNIVINKIIKVFLPIHSKGSGSSVSAGWSISKL